MTTEQKKFFDLSRFDIYWENKGYSICQIAQNNDLPRIRILAWSWRLWEPLKVNNSYKAKAKGGLKLKEIKESNENRSFLRE